MVRLEEGLKQLTDVTNFHIYASYQINVAQSAVFRLQLGLGAAEANVDKIFWIPEGNDHSESIPSCHPSYSPSGTIEKSQGQNEAKTLTSDCHMIQILKIFGNIIKWWKLPL